MRPDLRFPRQERLKSRKSIENIFRSGKRVQAGDWRALFHFRPGSGIQIGVGAPSRSFKKAVDRNRIKRLIRESYRLDQHRWKQALNQRQEGMDIFFLYTGKALPDFHSARNGLDQLFEKIMMA